MNTEQKDRLLKLAENNPDLAKDVVDILKAEADKSDAPVAVKVVKDEADKIEITAEQKKWAIGYITTVTAFVVLLFSFVIGISINADNLSFNAVNNMFWLVFTLEIFIVLFAWLCAYKAGMPIIKSFCAKHFKFK